MPPVLQGIRILDFSQYIAGPFAAMLLGEQGAEVIKVERPDGDPMRQHQGFIVWNRSKKNIKLNLKESEGLQIAHKLAKQSDVVIESFRPGIAEKLGIGYETINELNPRTVYCSISGFGPDGPYRDLPGWDPIVASVAGVYTTQAGEESPPLYLVAPLPSYYTAFMTCFSIMTALFARQATGHGQQINMSLLAGILSAASSGIVDFEDKISRVSGVRDQQGGSPLYRLYQGSDGKWFFLGLGNLSFFAKFAVTMGHDEWLVDKRFEGAPFLILPPASTELIDMLQDIFSTKTRDDWLQFLRAADIPCAASGTVEEYLNDPQVIANDMVIETEQPGIGLVRQMGIPIRLHDNPGEIKGPAPELGEHTTEILSNLGYTAEEITKLANEEII